MAKLDEYFTETDVLVIGAGAGGLLAALTCPNSRRKAEAAQAITEAVQIANGDAQSPAGGHDPADQYITRTEVAFGMLGKAIAYPPGSYIREPAGVVHYLLTKDEVVEVEVRGMGPRQNTYAK